VSIEHHGIIGVEEVAILDVSRIEHVACFNGATPMMPWANSS
jgi:hypothetical protein